MKVSVYIATSLDGFIARPDGSLDWLTGAGIPGDPEDYGYAAFIADVDCLVMGRKTLETVLSFPEWPYTGKRVLVLSRTLDCLPAAALGKAELFKGDAVRLAATLAAQDVHHVYLDGGLTIQSFLRDGLVDELTITRIPVLLGKGLPLFGSLHADVHLEHLATTSYPSGFVQSRYRVRRANGKTSSETDSSFRKGQS